MWQFVPCLLSVPCTVLMIRLHYQCEWNNSIFYRENLLYPIWVSFSFFQRLQGKLDMCRNIFISIIYKDWPTTWHFLWRRTSSGVVISTRDNRLIMIITYLATSGKISFLDFYVLIQMHDLNFCTVWTPCFQNWYAIALYLLANKEYYWIYIVTCDWILFYNLPYKLTIYNMKKKSYNINKWSA